MHLRMFAVMASVLALNGCANAPDISAENAVLATAYRNGANGAETLPSFGRAVRSNGDLTFKLANGKSLTLQDDNRGCSGDDNNPVELCHRFTMLADLPSRHFFLVVEGYYEGADFFLIDDRTGRETQIDAVPIFSPNGEYFLVQDDNEASEHENNLEIWRREGDGAVLEWAHSISQAIQETPQGLLYHTEVISWTGDEIALQFSIGAYAQRPALKWTGSLKRQSDGWHLTAAWPKSKIR